MFHFLCSSVSFWDSGEFRYFSRCCFVACDHIAQVLSLALERVKPFSSFGQVDEVDY